MYILLSELKTLGNNGLSFDNKIKNFIEDSFLSRNIHINNELHISGNCFLIEDSVIVEAVLEYDLNYCCDRCLEEVKKHYKQKLSFTKNIDELVDEKVLFDDEIKDTILLSISTKMLCKENCSGLCQECGANLNFEKCNCNKYKKLTKGIKINNR